MLSNYFTDKKIFKQVNFTKHITNNNQINTLSNKILPYKKLLISISLILILIFFHYILTLKYVQKNYKIEDGILVKYINNSNKACIPYWATKIDGGAFNKDDLKDINVSKLNMKFASMNGILYNKSFTVLIESPRDHKNFNISNKLTKIERWAFKDCIYLKTITLPQGLERIEFGAFSGCLNLKNITIPKTVKYIGKNAFDDC